MNDLSEHFHSGRVFDNPFMLPSGESMPTSFQSAMDVALFLYGLNPLYGRATARIVSHFITDLNFPADGAANDKENLGSFLKDDLQLLAFSAEVGQDWACYGNAYVRIHFPFDRFLVLPNGKRIAVEQFGRGARYNHTTMRYTVQDPTTKTTVSVPFEDRVSTDRSRIVLRRLNPRYVTVIYNQFSGSKRFVYRFEPETLQAVRNGHLHMVNELPMVMLRAIKEQQDFLFAPDSIFHFMAPTVSGLTQSGIGVPGTLLNYRNLHQLQVYRKLDEAIGLDYMTPFRLFSPAVDLVNAKEAMGTIIGGRWRSEVAKMISNRRRDKFAIHSVPFPINYQELGGDGKELTPKDLMEFQTASFLDGLGYPQELFKGTLAYMQVPTAMRLFENSFSFIHHNYNRMFKWINRKTSEYLNRTVIPVSLKPPSIVDNIERRQIMLQLAAMGEISRATAYEGVGVDDMTAEIRRRLEEDAMRAKLEAKLKADLDREMATGTIMATTPSPDQGNVGGSGSLPGGPPAGNTGPAVTPGDVMSEAQEVASYWGQLPEGERRKAMMAQKAGKPEVYALAKQLMEDARSQGEAQGRQMANEQMAGGGQPQ